MKTTYSAPHFQCPQCKKINRKSPVVMVLCEAYMKGKNLPELGIIPDSMICAQCQTPIDARKIIQCSYDYDTDNDIPVNVSAAYYVPAILISILLLKLVFHWVLIAAIFVGLFAGVALGQITIYIRKALKKR